MPDVVKGHLDRLAPGRYGGNFTWDVANNTYIIEEYWLGDRNSRVLLDFNKDKMIYQNHFKGECHLLSHIPDVYKNLPTKTCIPDSLTSDNGHLVYTVDQESQDSTKCDLSSLKVHDKKTYFHYDYYNFTRGDPIADVIADIEADSTDCDDDADSIG